MINLASMVGPSAPTITNRNGSQESICELAPDVCPTALRLLITTPAPSCSAEITRTAGAILHICGRLDDTFDGGPSRFDELISALHLVLEAIGPRPAGALLEVAHVLWTGEQKYGDAENWRRIDAFQHQRHALVHLLAHEAGDRSEGDVGHLTRAACRLMFAIEVLHGLHADSTKSVTPRCGGTAA